MFETLGIALAAVHFAIPTLYYWRARRWLRRDWGVREEGVYTPRVTVIIPTYNEADAIEERLNNIYSQDYPREKLEIIVVDSASADGTPAAVEKWAGQHRDKRPETPDTEIAI
ncbi:glycosyltransferase [Pyrobaculum sp.]|uniref:glycosyltransferase n=1 Tax=Pyrobaculum sp. TaxID=2004705 RepID=UPI0031828591